MNIEGIISPTGIKMKPGDLCVCPRCATPSKISLNFSLTPLQPEDLMFLFDNKPEIYFDLMENVRENTKYRTEWQTQAAKKDALIDQLASIMCLPRDKAATMVNEYMTMRSKGMKHQAVMNMFRSI